MALFMVKGSCIANILGLLGVLSIAAGAQVTPYLMLAAPAFSEYKSRPQSGAPSPGEACLGPGVLRRVAAGALMLLQRQCP